MHTSVYLFYLHLFVLLQNSVNFDGSECALRFPVDRHAMPFSCFVRNDNEITNEIKINLVPIIVVIVLIYIHIRMGKVIA